MFWEKEYKCDILQSSASNGRGKLPAAMHTSVAQVMLHKREWFYDLLLYSLYVTDMGHLQNHSWKNHL